MNVEKDGYQDYKLYAVIILSALLAAVVVWTVFPPVSAYDYTGDITYVSPVIQDSYTHTYTGANSNNHIFSFRLVDVANYTNLKYIYGSFDNGSYGTGMGHDAGVVSASQVVYIYYGSQYIGSGLFGYYDNIASGKINVYLSMYDFDATGITGTQDFNMSLESPPSIANNGWITSHPTGLLGVNLKGKGSAGAGVGKISFLSWAAYPVSGDYVTFSSYSFNQRWFMTAITPIAVYIDILKLGEESQVSVYQTDNTLVATDGLMNTNDYNFTTIQKPLKLAFLDSRGMFHNTSYMYAGETGYSIVLDATNITPSGTTHGTISSDTDVLLSLVTGIAWRYTDFSGRSYYFYDSGNTSRPMDYILSSGVWYGYDSTLGNYNINKGAGVPNPVTLGGIPGTGVYTVVCYISSSSGNYYAPSATLNVGGGEVSGQLWILTADWRSGEAVQNAAINVQTVASGVWSNETPGTGERMYYAPVGTRIYAEAIATGYDVASGNGRVSDLPGNSLTLTMFPTGSGSTNIDNSTWYVQAFDYDSGYAKQGVTVRVVDDGQTKVTGYSGTVSFSVINGSLYTVSATCGQIEVCSVQDPTHFCPSSYTEDICIGGTKTETVHGASYVTQFFLAKPRATAAPTATRTLAPGQTASPTPLPTLDTRTNEQKGNEMVGFLYDNGYTLVVIFFLCTVVGALQMMGGRGGKK